MDQIKIITLIVSAMTLLVALGSAIMNYRLARQKKRIEHLEKNYRIAIENLQALYQIEEYFAGKLKMSRRQLQNELRKWIKENNLNIKRDFFSPAFFDSEMTYLGK
jgi:hypothetical protein